MAIIYSMYIETGTSKECREAVEAHFLNCKEIRLNGRDYKIESFRATNGCAITVEGITRSGVSNKEECIELSELGFKFYDILKTAPPFRFAVAGVEADDCVEYEDLINNPPFHKNFAGLVISNEIYESSAEYADYQYFNDTHKWNPMKVN